MQVSSQTDLMANQKSGSSLPADAIFDVLQTSTGDSLFFSIGSDGVFYVTRELVVGETGWDRIDLSSSLSGMNGGATVVAKIFAACQNPTTGLVDIALVITLQGSDELYMLRGHSAEVTTWEDASTIVWTPLPWDVPQDPSPAPLVINNVYLLVGPSATNPARQSVENFFVDVIRNPGDPVEVLLQYYIYPDADTKWNPHQVHMEVTVSSHAGSCLGQPTGHVPGIYTLTIDSDIPLLNFASQHNPIGGGPVTAVRLRAPPTAKAITAVPNSVGDTNLLVICDDGLHIFGPDNQRDGAQPSLVVPAANMGDLNLFTKIDTISAFKSDLSTVVWVKNEAGTLFNFRCAAGSELDPSAWTIPFPFQLGIKNFAFYLNDTSGTTVFAHMPGLDMVQHRMDDTGLWRSRQILLTSTSGADVYSTYNSFTTNITVTDSTGAPVPNTSLTITSQSPVAVNVDNVAYNLSPTASAIVVSDASGVVVVIQETPTISGVTIYAHLTSDSSNNSTTNPLDVSHNTLKATTRADLDTKKITGSDGQPKLLVPSDVPSANKDSVFGSLQTLLQHPSLQNSSQSTSFQGVPLENLTVLPPTSVRSSAHHIANLSSGSSWIDVAFGDLVHFCRKAVDTIVAPLVQAAEKVWHFTVTIAGKLYHAVVNTAEEAFHAIQVVFSDIKVLFDDLVSWLGTLFNWGNIVRTHNVIKTEITARITTAINAIPVIENKVDALFDGLEAQINAWANFTNPDGTMVSQQQKGSDASSQANSAKSNWAMYHTKNGIGSASASTSVNVNAITSVAVSDDLDAALTDLATLGSTIEGDIGTAVSQIKTQVVDSYSSLTALQIVTKVIAILGDLLLQSTKDVIVKLLAVVKALAADALTLLTTPLPIPILSTIYKAQVGSDMTVLDLVCLVAAIPVAIVYDFLSGGTAPFPDDDSVSGAATAGNTRRAAQQALLSNFTPPSAPEQPHSSNEPKTKHKSGCNSNDSSTTAITATSLAVESLAAGDILTILFDIAAVPGVGLTILAADAARKNPSQQIRLVGFAGAMLYMAPGYEVWPATDTWPNNINVALGAICVVKALVDAVCINPKWTEVSPVLDFELNAAGLAATIGGFKALTSPQPADDTMFAGNLCYDLAGILSPEVDQPQIRVVQGGLNCVYGILCAVTAKLYYDEN